jgi:hypothetical protein
VACCRDDESKGAVRYLEKAILSLLNCHGAIEVEKKSEEAGGKAAAAP